MKKYIVSIVSFLTFFAMLMPISVHADEYWFSDNIPGNISTIPLPEGIENNKINIRDSFNVPGSRQEYALWNGDKWSMYYDGNSTYKLLKYPYMSIMHNDSWYGQKGMMWYNEPVNLNYAFETEAYFLIDTLLIHDLNTWKGASNGITFTIQNDPAGANAIGGRGGGIGVYPGYYHTVENEKTVNMIYNALSFEFDTSSNFTSSTTGYISNQDRKLTSAKNATPHAAFNSTYVPSTISYGTSATQYVLDNFIHDGLTKPETANSGYYSNLASYSEGNSWFNQWIKVNIKWEPVLVDGVEEGDQENITDGILTYQIGDITNPRTKEVYQYQPQSTTVDIDKQFNSQFTKKNWDRTAYWGFTSAGTIRADGKYHWGTEYYKSGDELNSDGTVKNRLNSAPGAVIVNKLPFEADVDVSRNVKNITKGETAYKSETTAKVGEIVEYEVTIQNNKIPQSNLPFSRFKLQEDLKNNEYVTGSFNFTSDAHTGPVARINTKDGQNIFTIGLDSYNSDKTSGDYTPQTEIDKYHFDAGTSFTYTYQVKIGEDSVKFDNNISIESAYTSGMTVGDTSVSVYPKTPSLTKSVPAKTNPIVGEGVEVTLDLAIEKGLMRLTTLKDSIPEGFSLKNNTSVINIYANDGSLVDSIALSDQDVWANKNFEINETKFSRMNELLLQGGALDNQKLQLKYTIVPEESVKGQVIDLPTSFATGKSWDKVENYEFQDQNNVGIKVKTDYVIIFKYKGVDMNSDWISSTNSDFHKKNRVKLYFNTGDNYSIKSIINEISTGLKTNHDVVLYETIGDGLEDTIKATGNQTTLNYRFPEVTLKVKQLYSDDVTKPIYGNLKNETPIDNSKNVYPVEIGASLATVVQKTIIDNNDISFTLNYDGYKPIKAVDYKVMINGVESSTTTVPAEDFEIYFLYDGLVSLNVSNLKYGSVKLTSKDRTYHDRKNQEAEVVVTNTTLDPNWTLTVSLPDGINNIDTQTKYIGGLSLNRSGSLLEIGNDPVMFGEQTASDKKLLTALPLNIQMYQDLGNELGSYEGSVNWTLCDIPNP